MPVIPDLPNEVLGLVLRQIQPCDLEAFLQVSKSVRQNLEWPLREHYHLKRIYSTFRYHEDTPRGAPARLLKTILSQPRIADYVLEMDVKDWEMSFRYSMTHLEYTMEDTQLFKTTVKASKYVFSDCLERFLDEIEDGDEQPILMLLLTLLPNLEHVRIVSDSHIDLSITINMIADEEPVQCLTRLTSLHLQAHELEIGGWVDYPHLLPVFCLLPSMKTLSIDRASANIVGYDYVEKRTFYDGYGAIPIVHLTLSDCLIYSSLLCGFLSHCTSLESFEYWPDFESPAGNPESFNPGGLIKALQKQCTNTLKSLTILCKILPPAKRMGSLQPFHKLENLTTNLSLLIGRSPHHLTELPPPADEGLLSDTLPPRLAKLTLEVAEEPKYRDPNTKREHRHIAQLLRTRTYDDRFTGLETISIQSEEASESLDVATMLFDSDGVYGWGKQRLDPIIHGA